MCSRPLEGNDSDFHVLDVNQQPVGVDVTFPTAFILAVQLMVSAFFGKRLACFQQVSYGKKIIHRKPSFFGQFQVFLELTRWNDLESCHNHNALTHSLKSS